MSLRFEEKLNSSTSDACLSFALWESAGFWLMLTIEVVALKENSQRTHRTKKDNTFYHSNDHHHQLETGFHEDWSKAWVCFTPPSPNLASWYVHTCLIIMYSFIWWFGDYLICQYFIHQYKQGNHKSPCREIFDWPFSVSDFKSENDL